LGDWGLNSRLCTHLAGALLLQPYLQPFFLLYFLDKIFHLCSVWPLSTIFQPPLPHSWNYRHAQLCWLIWGSH
jgi:hypothetical protein